jgi:hypothetical protein
VRRLTFLHGVPSFRQGRRSRSTAAAVAVLRGGAPAVAAVRPARGRRRGKVRRGRLQKGQGQGYQWGQFAAPLQPVSVFWR